MIMNFINYLINFLKSIRRDLRGIYLLGITRLMIMKLKLFNESVNSRFENWRKRNPEKVAFICNEKRWTYREVEEYTNQIANYFTGQGLKPGDEVALFMPSKAEHCLIWFGLSKIGVITALINENLKSEPLVHCITCVQSKAVIFDADLSKEIIESYSVLNEKRPEMKYYSYGPVKQNQFRAPNLQEKLSEQRFDVTIAKHINNFNDPIFFLYTSGTTGLPKAVLIRHSRMLMASIGRSVVLKITSVDIIYNAMPVYHSLGVTFGVLSALITGNTVVIRGKFSASKFWDDCIKYDCTTVPYVGEVCRYLLAQPPNIRDKMHKVTKMCGVGLRPSIWKDFVQRFGVTNIMEMFGSTEGNSNLVNVDFKEGACGFIPVWLPNFIFKRLIPVKLIKVDQETGEVFRDKYGRCVILGTQQTGMLIALIDNSDPISAFEGYVDKKDTEKKIIRNVFQNGDAYFISGDLIYMDAFGYIYFRDRVGDTFRWKGENVSTNEVEGLISKILDIPDCVVYGVEIPNADGRAGMVAISTTQEIDFKTFYKNLHKTLPKYAVPIFIRIKKEIELTGTFKFSKVSLKREAFNVEVTKDPIFVIDTNNKTYVKLDKNFYEDIINGQICF